MIHTLEECFGRAVGVSGHWVPAQIGLSSVNSVNSGCIVPPMDVSSKWGCVWRKMWSMREGCVVVVLLKEEKGMPSGLGSRNLS